MGQEKRPPTRPVLEIVGCRFPPGEVLYGGVNSSTSFDPEGNVLPPRARRPTNFMHKNALRLPSSPFCPESPVLQILSTADLNRLTV